jgi:hypothetical protein
MPVEIKELNIRANISDQPAAAANAGITSQQLEQIKRDIKRECMEELKQFIKDQTER